ncbi:hypothetical protein, partial [Priestia megaterium]|uniref:hypothetical protein n=1 Tax=Priestia megaterium TaxID=1404 RepID=UPI00300B9B3F
AESETKTVKATDAEIKAKTVKATDAEIKAKTVKATDAEIKAKTVKAEKKKTFWKYWIWMGLGFIALVAVMIPILYYWFRMGEYLKEGQHFKNYIINAEKVPESKELKEIVKYMNKSSFVLGIVSSLVGVSVISKGIAIYLRGKKQKTNQ